MRKFKGYVDLGGKREDFTFEVPDEALDGYSEVDVEWHERVKQHYIDARERVLDTGFEEVDPEDESAPLS